ncbi:MAG TPA: OmpH family outer membrane protein [Phycisphaerae bacterium]|nr:OmpH family outer membrane protein [Phycisphaerae bacterium]
MKASRIVLVLGCAAVVGVMVWTNGFAQTDTAAQAKPSRVAVLDVKEVLENYERAKDLMNDLQKRGMQLEEEDKQRKAAIDRIEAEMQQLKPGGPEYKKRAMEQQKLVIERDVWKKFQTSVLLGEHHGLTRILYEDIRKMAALVAEQQGIDIVLYTEHKMPETKSSPELGKVLEDRKVLYAAPSVDLTETVLKRLNQAHRTAGKP